MRNSRFHDSTSESGPEFYSVPNAKKARKKINFLIILPIPMKKALKRLKYWCFADRIQIEFMLAIELDTDKFERVNGSVKTNKTRLESGLQKMFKNIVDSSCRL